MTVEHPLPADGVDLRAELAAHQHSRVEQALARSPGDLTLAAKLLRVTPLELSRLHAGMNALTPTPTAETRAAAREAMATPPQATAEPASRERSRINTSRWKPRALAPVKDDELGRVERGIELISGAAIRRLAADGFNERQIATRLGCNPYVVEKVLRMQTERGLCKCGARREPERNL